MSLTTDPADPRLGHGTDTSPGPQNTVYLVLSEEERAKGWVRPLRLSYRHVGIPGPRHPLRDLTAGENERHAGCGYVKYEQYPPDSHALGRFWTQAQLDAIGNGCGTVTTMSRALAETYAARPGFYGATYCCGCMRHLPVGPHGEFTWIEADGTEAGNRVGT
jgi:hypothetical protein